MLILILIVVVVGIWVIRKAAGGNDGIDTSARVNTPSSGTVSTPIVSNYTPSYKAPAKITELCCCVKDDGSDSTRLMNVAGVGFHTNRIRGIYGIVANEATNKYNSRAMAVKTADGEMIGYIPERELEDYWEWTSGAKFPFVGFVNRDGEGKMYSIIKVIRPVSKFVVLDEARKQSEYLARVYDLSGRFDPKIPDVADEALFQRLREAEEAIARVIKTPQQPAAKDVIPQATKETTQPVVKKPRRDKWGTYLKEFEMLEITKATALKENRELEFTIDYTYYNDEIKNISAGVFYGSMREVVGKPGIFAVYNKKKLMFELDENDSKEYAKFYGKPAPVVCEVTKRYGEVDGEVDIEWEIEGVAILPLSEEFVVPEIELTWGAYGGKEDKLPKW